MSGVAGRAQAAGRRAGRPAPGPIDAFLYSDRGVYRPGETVELMALVRDSQGYARDSLPLTLNCLLSTIHGFFAIIFVATIIAHAYLGTIANPSTWSAIVDGKVSRLWAKKHHSEWYKGIGGEEGEKAKREKGEKG